MELTHIIALLLVTVAAGFDLKHKRIPNLLTYSSWAVGFALAAVLGGWTGMSNAALGFAAGFMPLFVLFLGGSLGAGDVKLMGGVGALLGFPAGLNALISSILVGGLLAAIILLWQGRLFGILHYAGGILWSKVYPAYIPEPPPDHKDSFPFGIAIAIGTYLTIASIMAGKSTPAQLLG